MGPELVARVQARSAPHGPLLAWRLGGMKYNTADGLHILLMLLEAENTQSLALGTQADHLAQESG